MHYPHSPHENISHTSNAHDDAPIHSGRLSDSEAVPLLLLRGHGKRKITGGVGMDQIVSHMRSRYCCTKAQTVQHTQLNRAARRIASEERG